MERGEEWGGGVFGEIAVGLKGGKTVDFFGGLVGGVRRVMDGRGKVTRLVWRGVDIGSFLDFLERDGMEFFSVSFFDVNFPSVFEF